MLLKASLEEAPPTGGGEGYVRISTIRRKRENPTILHPLHQRTVGDGILDIPIAQTKTL